MNHIAIGGPLTAAIAYAISSDPIISITAASCFYAGVAVQAIHNHRERIREIYRQYEEEVRDIECEFDEERLR
jgi:hypothetical protein